MILVCESRYVKSDRLIAATSIIESDGGEIFFGGCCCERMYGV
jgi:hypothetical protein